MKLTETPKKNILSRRIYYSSGNFFWGVFFHGKKLSFLDMEIRIPERGPQTELSTVAWRGSTRTLDGSKNNEGSLTMMRFLVKLRGNVDIYKHEYKCNIIYLHNCFAETTSITLVDSEKHMCTYVHGAHIYVLVQTIQTILIK